MAKGKIKEYDSNRGCGTIIASETGQELTVYANNVKAGENLQKGQEVEFEIENIRHQNWAVNVRLLLG